MDRRRSRFLTGGLTLVILASSLTRGQTPEGEPALPANMPQGWYARIDTTAGSILVRLLPEQAPQSVAHFAALAEGRLEWFDRVAGKAVKGRFYDGLEINPGITGSHFAVGDPQGASRGSPDIFLPLEGRGPVNFGVPGRLGLSRLGRRISAVQFFVTPDATPWLNGTRPCIGTVVSGLDVVRTLARSLTGVGEPSETRHRTERVEVFAVGEPAPLPEPVATPPPYGVLRERPDRVQTQPD